MASSDFRAMIKEGMTVVDSGDNSVGTIEEVFMGTGSEEVEALASAQGGPDSSGVLPDAADPFVDGRDLPDPLRKRLLSKGYLRIDTGFGGPRFATMDQLASLSEGVVTLTVAESELIQ